MMFVKPPWKKLTDQAALARIALGGVDDGSCRAAFHKLTPIKLCLRRSRKVATMPIFAMNPKMINDQ
jgi:hypothetical protein